MESPWDETKHLKILRLWLRMTTMLLSAVICVLYLRSSAFASSETSNWQSYPKWLTGSSTLGSWADKSNAGFWNGQNWVVKISSENPSKAFFPGRDYYYLYQTTTPALVWDQRENQRFINLPILGIDLILSNGTTYYKLNDYTLWYGSYSVDSGFWEIYDNWGGGNTTDSRRGPPLPPTNITGELISTASGINAQIQWTAPSWNGEDIKDLTTGGGYEIWRSSSPEFILGAASFSTNTFTQITTISGPAPAESYTDTGLLPNVTYYYSLRSYDAYLPADYSDFSYPVAFYGVSLPVDITFKIDVSGFSPKRVFVAGDFTEPVWFDGKFPMNDNKDGTWRVKIPYSAAKPLKLIIGKTIQYRYVMDDTIESDFLTLSKNREVVLRSTNTVLSDVWGVITITSTPKNLAEELVSFRTEILPTGINIVWETDPKKLPDIAGYEIQYSFDNFVTSSTVISSTDTSVCFVPGFPGPGFYKIAIVYKNGTKSNQSDTILKGEEVPQLTECTDAGPINNLAAKTGVDTGEIILSWDAPGRSDALGAANHYIIRRATYPLTTVSAFKRGIITGKEKAHYTGAGEMYVTVKLGEMCPGYYFGIEAIYGNWYAATVSSSIIGVAGKFVSTKKGGTTEKSVRMLGNDELAGAVKYSSKPEIEMKRYAVANPNAVFVIKNSFEISGSAENELKEKIAAAANPQLPSQKRLKLLSENISLSNPDSMIFEFSALSPSGEKLFADGENVKLPFTISIPFDMLDKNLNGIADSSEGSQKEIKVDDLRVYYLNEKYNFWQRLKDGKNYVDKEKKLVKAETKHLSVFCLASPGNAADDLSNVVVFPNPFKPYDGKPETGSYETGIIFTNLTPTAEFFIYNIAAELVKKHKLEGITDDEKEGKWKWDVRNTDGERVASGVYVFLVKDENIKTGKDKFVGKLCIIR